MALKAFFILFSGSEGPRTSNPARYIRYIYNRVILENATVRAAAVSALSRFGALCDDLLPNVLVWYYFFITMTSSIGLVQFSNGQKVSRWPMVWFLNGTQKLQILDAKMLEQQNFSTNIIQFFMASEARNFCGFRCSVGPFQSANKKVWYSDESRFYIRINSV